MPDTWGGNTKLKITIKEGESLLEALRSQGQDIFTMCGGRGTCGKCRVVVLKGTYELAGPKQTEKALLSKEDLNSGYRLSCLTRAIRPTTLEIRIPPESEQSQQRLMVSGTAPAVRLVPAVRKIFIKLPPPSLQDTMADLERLTEVLKKKTGLDHLEIGYDTLKELPYLLRTGCWEVTTSTFRDKEIIGIQAGDDSNSCFGFAVDIGTTKIAGYLVDLTTGKTVVTVSSLNPQAKFGADIISRITYSMKGKEAAVEVTRCIIDAVNRLIREACEKSGLSPQDIADITVAGNTAMHHMFLGVTPRYLSLSPYPAVLRRGLEIRATDLGLQTAPDSRAYLFPVIAGFVGGDAVADIIATEIHLARDLSMLIDIGTNAEIILGNSKGLLACSCASGPAFEGAHIKQGMRASQGAIEKIWIDPQTLDVSYRAIGGIEPVGICGSAIVEGVAEMFRAGIVDSRGRICVGRDTQRIREVDGTMEFMIVDRSLTGIDDDIVITQSDVREIQLAKAAVYTGISILMKRMQVKPEEIRRIFLAGAFGTYIDPSSARDIGMFPDIPLSRIQFVGNTAGAGARMALISTPIREIAEKVLHKTRYVELGADSEFQKEFMSAIDIPNADVELFPSVSHAVQANGVTRRKL